MTQKARPQNVPQCLAAAAAAAPDRVALSVERDGRLDELTYRAWDARSNSIARGLGARGVRTGDRIGLLFAPRDWIEFAVALLGVQKIGAAAVPLASELTDRELDGIVGAAGIEHVVTTTTAAPRDAVAALLFDDVASGGDEPVVAPVGPADLAGIVYTSGTTGTPKGVAYSHGNAVFDVGSHTALVSPTETSAARTLFLHSNPPWLASGQGMIMRALSGVPHVMLPDFTPDAFAALVAGCGVTHVRILPAHAIVLARPGATNGELVEIRAVFLGSAPMPPAVLETLDGSVFRGATIYNHYTTTEALPARVRTSFLPEKPATVGRPFGGTELEIRTDGRTARVGEAGEIWLAHRSAPQRWYFGDPAASADVFRDGWTRTGDLGYVDADGDLFLVDRVRDEINCGGNKVSTIEVEYALAEHPAVHDAAVAGIPNEVMGELVGAVVVSSDPMLTASDLQRFVRRSLAPSKIPVRIVFADELPRNRGHKVSKAALRRFLSPEPGAGVPCRTPTEVVLAGIWREALALEHDGAGREDDFFALGGHSLAAAQAMARASEVFGVELPFTLVLDHPTLAEQAAYIDTASQRTP